MSPLFYVALAFVAVFLPLIMFAAEREEKRYYEKLHRQKKDK